MFIARLRQLSYLIRQGGQNLKSGGVSTAITILSIACVLLLMCLYLMAFSNLFRVLDSAKNMKLVLYLRENLSAKQISCLQQKIASYAEISRVDYISKSMALKKFRKTLGEDAVLLDGLDTNPLPASLELFPSLKEPEQLKPLLHRLSSMPEVESVQGGVEWIQKLSDLLAAARLVFFFLGTALAVISLFITSSTIHLTIDRRREEIIVMRLVGASEWYIRLPFLFEGILEGFGGGCLAVLTSAALYEAFCWKINPVLRLALIKPTFLGLDKIILILLMGSLVGGLGAMISFSYRPAQI